MLRTALLVCAALQAPGAPERPFEAYVWRQPGVPAEEAARVLEAIGGTLALGGESSATWAAAGLDVLLFNAPGRDSLHLERDRPGYRERWERWFDERDDELLVRVPCLTDPELRARLASTLAANLERGVEALAGISIGDEVGLTPHSAPEDVCLSPTCRRAWGLWLSAQPELSEADRERFADPADFSTDDTRLAFGDGDTAAFWPWLLRRRFHECVVRGLVLDLARRARGHAPDVGVGLLGLGTQSPFGTPRSELLLSELDFAEAYREVDARELLFTARTPRQRVLLTVFPEAGRPERAAWDVWEHALRGGDGLVVWSDAVLAGDAAVRERVAGAIAAVRTLPADFSPAPGGVAVLHDFDSLALAWLRDALLDGPTWPRRLATHQVATGTWETGLRGWLSLLEDLAFQPGALALDAVGEDTPARFGLLVASELAVLDPSDLERLGRHVGAGGHLWVSGSFGLLGSRGDARERDAAFEELRALAPERVRRIPEELGDYPLERSRRSPRARAWRAHFGGLLAELGIGRAPWRVAPADPDLPYLCTWSTDAAGVVTGAVLPNAMGVLGAGGLVDLALTIEPAGGGRVEWLHPEPGPSAAGPPTLRAGDALVFRIVP